MEKNNPQKRLIFTYLILTIALVCTVLILSELWSNVYDLVPHPWEGPSPTSTLWWRSPQTATPTQPAAAVLPDLSNPLLLRTPVPVAGSTLEIIDG